ncbi:hypothetical protein K474DRAFT_906595 [Panus rudis PR-1116 ss-1]|nr:hypothetical protein K474DRAFT_906595 [Panus rudis PR-1116 ss-1]
MIPSFPLHSPAASKASRPPFTLLPESIAHGLLTRLQQTCAPLVASPSLCLAPAASRSSPSSFVLNSMMMHISIAFLHQNTSFPAPFLSSAQMSFLSLVRHSQYNKPSIVLGFLSPDPTVLDLAQPLSRGLILLVLVSHIHPKYRNSTSCYGRSAVRQILNAAGYRLGCCSHS